MAEQCAQCGTQACSDAVALRVCTACKTMHYCSRDCQKRHWKQHKAHCKKIAQLDSTSTQDSKQKTEPQSEASGRETTAGATQSDHSTGAGPLMTCQKCGIQRPVMDKCGRCQEVTYCSRDCQRADWKAHRVPCQTVDVVTTDGFKRTTGRERAEQQASKERIEEADKTRHLTTLLSNVSLTSDPTWAEARSRAQRLYPKKRVVDKFRDLQTDMMFVPNVQNVVALVKIKCVYPNPCREGRCIEDAEGTASHILFHNEGNPRPHFRYEQMVEGNFLCYENAYIHCFADGSLGFRVNYARNVRVLEFDAQAVKSTSGSSKGTADRKSGKKTSTPHHPPSDGSDPTTPLSHPPASPPWREARSRALAAFPGSKVVDSFPDLDGKGLQHFAALGMPMLPPPFFKMSEEMQTFMKGETSVPLLVLLMAPIFDPMLRGWVVQDSKGNTAHLKFYLRGSPEPHFRYEDLHRGDFLCVRNTEVIVEQDDFAFIHVKDTSTVRVFSIG